MIARFSVVLDAEEVLNKRSRRDGLRDYLKKRLIDSFVRDFMEFEFSVREVGGGEVKATVIAKIGEEE